MEWIWKDVVCDPCKLSFTIGQPTTQAVDKYPCPKCKRPLTIISSKLGTVPMARENIEPAEIAAFITDNININNGLIGEDMLKPYESIILKQIYLEKNNG